MTTRLEQFYKDEVVPKLMQQFGYDNIMQVPRLVKITLNMGVGEAASNKKVLENAVADMTKIAGQKPVVTKSRVSVASFARFASRLIIEVLAIISCPVSCGTGSGRPRAAPWLPRWSWRWW